MKYYFNVVLLGEVTAAVSWGVKKLLTEADYLKIRRKRRHGETPTRKVMIKILRINILDTKYVYILHILIYLISIIHIE